MLFYGKQMKNKITFEGYELKEIQPIDMRPQTFHIDLVAVWELSAEK